MGKLLLNFLLISFFTTPRIFGGVRLDDFILLLALPYILYNLKYFAKSLEGNPIHVYGIFILWSVVLLLYGGVLSGDVSEEGVELIGKYLTYLIAMALGYLIGIKYSLPSESTLKLLVGCVLLNCAWIAAQLLDGSFRTLWGRDDASSYGVKLIGEGAAFQVGIVCAYAAILSLLLSQYAKTPSRIFFVCIYCVLLYAVFASQSRISLAGLTLASGYLIFSSNAKLAAALLSAALVGIGFFNLNNLIESSDRLTFDGVAASLNVRVDEIWGGALESIGSRPLLGAGLGRVSAVAETSEMHNYFLRMLYEGGIVYCLLFALFLGTLLRVWRRSKNSGNIAQTKLLVSMGIVIVVSAVVQDSFSSSKAVLPFFILIGKILGDIERNRLKGDEI